MGSAKALSRNTGFTRANAIRQLQYQKSTATLPPKKSKTRARPSNVRFGKGCKSHDGGCGVKFADSQEVHKVVPRISSFSDEELSAIWFEGADFQEFVDDALKTVDKIEQGKTFKDKKYTATGLENLTEEGRLLKETFRENAYDAVMYLQEDQYQQGFRDSFQLADAYHQVSKEAARRAFNMALKLRRDVVSYMTCDDIGVDGKCKKKKKRAQKRRSSF